MHIHTEGKQTHFQLGEPLSLVARNLCIDEFSEEEVLEARALIKEVRGRESRSKEWHI